MNFSLRIFVVLSDLSVLVVKFFITQTLRALSFTKNYLQNEPETAANYFIKPISQYLISKAFNQMEQNSENNKEKNGLLFPIVFVGGSIVLLIVIKLIIS